MYYTVIKHDRYLRNVEKASVFYIFQVTYVVNVMKNLMKPGFLTDQSVRRVLSML